MGLPVMALTLACLLLYTLLFAQVVTITAAETVKVSTTPIFPQIQRGQASTGFQVLVRVEALPAADQKDRRVPINLVAVLDVGGDTARLDSVKKAIKFIIRQLHDDDRLAIVGPSSNRHSSGFLDIRDAKRNAEKMVDELEAPRDDNDHLDHTSGLEEAVKILEEEPPSSNSCSASFIVLVTDREDGSSRFNKKLRRDAILLAALTKHPVHTLGLGAAHDPKALQLIAEESHGTYSFVGDQNLDKITGALAVCLSGLKAVVAVGTRIGLKAAEGSGVEIERIESGGYNQSPVTRDKTSGEVTIGALYAGEVKSFVVHLHVPAHTPVEGGCDQQRLLTASLHQYRSDDSSTAPPIQAVLIVQRPPAADAMLHNKVPVPIVVNHIVRFSVLEMVTSFVNKELWRLDSMTVEDRYGLGMKLQSQWEKFVQVRQFWSGLDLGGLETEITAMVRSLTAAGSSSSSRAAAAAYLFSWLSSYQMQRPTAMGSPANVAAAFVTLEMQLTLQQVAITTASGDSGCPACECVEPLPPPMFEPSGRDDDTYHVNAAYRGISLEAINQAMNQMYLAVAQASNLRLCDHSSSGAGILQQQQPQPPATA